MLVLSRKESEELIISDEIRIRVLRIQGGTIRLGIEAPQEVSIRRAELVRREGACGRTRAVSRDFVS